MTADAPPLTFNELLRLSGIAEKDVLVFRHRPSEPSLNRVFDWIVAERPDLFDCYQSSHGRKTESALKNARFVASCIRHEPGNALFVGLYELNSSREISLEETVNRPLHRELISYGMTGTTSMSGAEGRQIVTEFELRLTEWHARWRGRLIIRWPGLERSWYRWADRNEFAVEAIAVEDLLTPRMPEWHHLTLNWNELGLLPASWCAQLREWRGVYLIIDQDDAKQYVGSACGSENILQRWRDYSRSGHGGNRLLRGRDPANFRFSILERTSPDMPSDQVVAIEATWKERLRTRAPAGLNDN